GKRGVMATVRMVVAAAQEPAPGKLGVGRGIVSESLLGRRELLAITPDKFAASHERVVDRAAQRLPPQGGVDTVEVSEEIGTLIVMATSVGDAQVQVRRFGDVSVAPQVGNGAYVATL